MNTGEHFDSNPFADPSISDDQHQLVEDSTLSVGRNASLTLGTDSLIVLGMICTGCILTIGLTLD